MSSDEGQLAAFRGIIATGEPPRLGPERRTGTLGLEELNQAVSAFLEEQRIPARIHPHLRSAALLWHDHLDASHTISQGIESPEGSWLHGIMHRRERDYDNAKYWFQRVGQHEAFPRLAEQVEKLLHKDQTGLAARLIGNNAWQPFVFVDECEHAEVSDLTVLTSHLIAVQAIEFDVLVEHILTSKT